jgi:hypothetical protein
MKKCKTFAIFIFAVMLVVTCIPLCFAIDDIEASNSINQAELILNSGFILVAQGQELGVDVAEFITKLAVAGDFLSEAHLMFRVSDYEAANLFALECIKTVKRLNEEVDGLILDAEKTRSDVMFLNLIGSVVGLVFLVILSNIFWKFFKKWYFKKVLEKKPEMEAA